MIIMRCLIMLCYSGSPLLAEGTKNIEFKLTAKSIESDDGGDSYWIQSSDLAPEEIRVRPEDDSALSESISGTLNGQKGTDLVEYNRLLRGILDPQGRWPDNGNSLLRVEGFDNLPADPTAAQTMEVPVRIVLPPAPGIEGIEVYLISRSCPEYYSVVENGESGGEYQLSGPWSLLSLEHAFSIPMDTPAEKMHQAITARVIFSRGDVEEFRERNGLESGEAERRLIHQYQVLALQYMTKVIEAKMGPGNRYSEDSAREKARQIHGEVLGPLAGSQLAKDTGPVFRFFFEGFGLRDKAEIRVEGDADAQGDFEKLYLDFSSKGAKRRLLMDGTRLPTAAMIAADLKHLREDPLIASARLMESPDHIRYLCMPTLLSNRKVTVGAGAEYTSERGLTPILGLRVPSRSEDESDFRFEFAGGESSMSGDAEFLFPISPTAAGGLWDSVQGIIKAGADNFEDARYGNTLRDGVESTILDVAAGSVVRFDSFGHADRFEAMQHGYGGSARRLFRTAEIGFRFRDTELEGEAVDLAGLDEGVRSGPYVDLRVLFGDNLNFQTRGTSSPTWWTEGRLAIDTSLEALGGEADYLRVFTELEIRRNWKLYDKVGGQMAMGVSGGFASGGTPTFDYFGAGEDGLVRGLRDTEFIGRSFVGLHAELGCDVTPIFGGKAAAGPLDDSGMLILFGPFVDFGWLFDRFENGSPVSGERAIQSYGVQLEILQTNISSTPLSMSVGYGWSPQSVLEENGSVFSRVSLRF